MAVDRSQAVIQEIRETPGQWLYHYTTLETALVHILPSQRLRLSPFSEMRDPREYNRWLPATAGFSELSGDVLARAWDRQSDRLNMLLNEFKLLSFTTDSECDEGTYGRGFARSRLWDAYAQRGSGVCLVLRMEAALRVIPPQLEAVGQPTHGRVRYENVPTHGEIMFHFEEMLGDLEAAADRIASNPTYVEKLFLTKNTEWDSEREYRFIVRSSSDYEYVDISEALIAVCRGFASVPEADHALRHFVNELDIGLGVVQWFNNTPTLLGRPLT
jgi:hypothetical protein